MTLKHFEIVVNTICIGCAIGVIAGQHQVIRDLQQQQQILREMIYKKK